MLSFFVKQFLEFFHKGGEQLVVPVDGAHDGAATENNALVTAAGHTEVAFPGLTRAVTFLRRSSTAFSRPMRSISVRPQVGQEIISGPRVLRPRERRIS